MKSLHAALAAALVLSGAAAASAQSNVSVKFHDGTVSLSAKDAPLRAILAEWARVGGAKIVNAERVPGGPLTLELSGVSEQEALDVLLRNVSGYIVAPRRAQAAAGASAFDRILILPTSAPVSAAPVRTQAPPPVVFFPGDPDENPAGDGPPNAQRPTATVPAPDIQRQLREAAARAEARQDEADDAEPEAADSESSRPGVSRTPASRPFGNVQGSSRPGEITTAPQRDDDDDDDDNRRRR